MTVDKVAIIIVHLCGFEVTHNCLCSLDQCGSKGFDIIVVDNGSTDGSASMLQQAHPEVVFLRSPVNAGFSGGNNIGITYALQHGYAYILLLNNDTIVTRNFLESLVGYLNEHPAVGAVQPKIFFHHNRLQLWSAGSFFNKLLGLTYTRGLLKTDLPAYNVDCLVDWISGCAMMIRSSVLRQTGLLAHNMFLYYEDVDLSFRIRKQGHLLAYVPASVIYHIAGASGKKKGKEGAVQPFVHYYNVRNRIWFLKQYTSWYNWPLVALTNGGYLLAMVLYFMLRNRKQKLKATLQGIRAGIKGRISYSEVQVDVHRVQEKSVGV